jgi:predicted nucleotidyltransferase
MKAHAPIDVPREAIAEFCQRNKIIELAMFGSAARGELRPDSDIDLMVTFAPDAAWTLFDFAGMQSELAQILGRDVDYEGPSEIHSAASIE